tara:strand:- start:12561 stop:12902 length:342 start_codon:yes stop_codon:yes gene_type:complete
MNIKLLKSKIHRATVKDTCLDYEGSISIDKTLMNAANLIAYEKVHVLDVTNGNRLETYVIESKEQGDICINGAAAHLVDKGDIVIIVSYASMSVDEAKKFKPTVVYPNENNEI